MNRSIRLRLLACVAALLTASAPVLAQDGKISGRVIDRPSGEPLPGVNVVVEGTQIGTATDVNGYFTILRVPPGEHAVVFSFLGYKRLRVQGVEVFVDRTTTVDAALEEEVFEGEEIVITADRPAVQRDLTGTATGYTQEQIQRAPVEGVRGVMRLTAAIDTNPDGSLTVRGSGPYDMQVLVNGAAQTMTSSGVPGYALEKANSSWKYDFNPLGVGQMEVISGGFSAEYGNAQSGIVKVATREGKGAFEAEYRTEYRAPGQYHWGNHFYSFDQPEFQRWGSFEAFRNAPELRDSSDLYVRQIYTQWLTNHLPRYTVPDTVYYYNPQARRYQVLYTPGQVVENMNGVYDYTRLAYTRHLFGVGGPLSSNRDLLRFHLSGEIRDAPTRIPTVEQVQEYRNVTLTTTLQPAGKHKFRLTNMYQFYVGGIQSGAEDIRYAGREPSWKYTLTQDSKREEVTLTQTLNYTFAASAKNLIEGTLSHSYEQYRVPMFPVVQRTNPWYVPFGPWDEGYRTNFALTSLYNQDARTRTLTGSAAWVSQLTRTWEAKAGAQYTQWETIYNGVSSLSPSAFISRTGFGDFYEAKPWLAAAYIQNKLEFEGMVANLGLRLDGFNYGTQAPVNRFAPFYTALGAEAVGDTLFAPSVTRWRVSPRIGLSFPIGERTAFRLQYGHFSAMPQTRAALSRTTNLGWQFYGNPNLRPERTVAFEVGVQQSVFQGTHRIDVVGYYNDRIDQINPIGIQAESGTIRSNPTPRVYTTYNNAGYSASYGTEFTFERMDRSPWTYRLSYSLARTTTGSYGSALLFSDDPEDPRNTRRRNRGSDYVSSNDRTHRLRTYLAYRWSDNEGPDVFGLKPLANADVSLIYSVQSGAPYTDRRGLPFNTDVFNNARYPFEEQVDLSFSKAVEVRGWAVSLGARVQNLFNNQWITPISGDDLNYWQEQGRFDDRYVPNQPNRGAGRTAYFYRNVPRQVFFSLGLRMR